MDISWALETWFFLLSFFEFVCKSSMIYCESVIYFFFQKCICTVWKIHFFTHQVDVRSWWKPHTVVTLLRPELPRVISAFEISTWKNFKKQLKQLILNIKILNPQHSQAENLKEIAEIDSGEGSGGERGRCGCRGCLWPRTPFPIRYLQHFRWTERTRYKVDEIWEDEYVHNISISFPQYFHDDSFFVTLVWCSDVVFIHLPWIPGVKGCTVGFFFLRNLRLDGGLPALSLETSWKSSANRRGKPMAGSLRCEEQVGFAEETLCRIWKQKKARPQKRRAILPASFQADREREDAFGVGCRHQQSIKDGSQLSQPNVHFDSF